MSTDVKDYEGAIAEYRRDLRAYLRDLDWADEWRFASFDNTEDAIAFDAKVLGRLHEAGWSRYGWPPEAGGLGGSEIHRAVYYEELSHAMLRVPEQHLTLEVIGQSLLEFAPELAAQYLPRYLAGLEWWCQCFSEPESGSDLATLRTRAVDDGAGGLVINGQKIWSSQGPTATRLLVLARTGGPDSRHRGLTMFVVDADSPGVTVRPIALASGRRELAEVFFDDVRVPTQRVVGGIGNGWAVTMYLMQYERGMYGHIALTKAFTQLGRLRADMVERGSSAAQRVRFARTYLAVVGASARCARTVQRLAAREAVGPESSVDKVLFATAEQDVNDLILDVQRAAFLGGDAAASHSELDEVRADWWYSRAATIMGGTAEIQRGIVADRLLGLPKESCK
ncbi:acyl-CoA dehydrogenase family protein [Mycobacterium sp. UM_CSW]|uniref:acyl-CoA dehydrogenase family protein n=1 Tax=Mycobacterium sp. UM_CSW TaxID=1370119 RepID=UPI000407128C|nr:acyl-CoA dehydrogenase family protein [Mycobacterium sp. UM_CSW]